MPSQGLHTFFSDQTIQSSSNVVQSGPDFRFLLCRSNSEVKFSNMKQGIKMFAQVTLYVFNKILIYTS